VLDGLLQSVDKENGGMSDLPVVFVCGLLRVSLKKFKFMNVLFKSLLARLFRNVSTDY